MHYSKEKNFAIKLIKKSSKEASKFFNQSKQLTFTKKRQKNKKIEVNQSK